MDYKGLIAQSWGYTQQNRRLIFWMGFLPSLFTTSFTTGYILYQFFAFRSSELFNSSGDNEFLQDLVGDIWNFTQTNVTWTVPLIVAAVIYAFFLLFFPTLCKASAIQTIARARNGQKSSVGIGLKYGISSYLPLLEYQYLVRTFAFLSIIFEMGVVLRNMGPDFFLLMLPVFIIFLAVSLLLTLLFTFADFYIVIDREGVFDSMRKSAKLVLANLKHTVLISILMLLIGVRILIQALIVFIVPIFILLVGGYIATIALPITGIIVGSILGVGALAVSAYINGTVDIFSYTVWTYAFLDLDGEEEMSAREITKQ